MIGNAGFRAEIKISIREENSYSKIVLGSSLKNFELTACGINDGSNSEARRFGSKEKNCFFFEHFYERNQIIFLTPTVSQTTETCDNTV